MGEALPAARATGQRNHVRVVKSSDRWIYLPAAVAITAVVAVGFAPSYFLRPFVAHTDSLTLLVHVHGALLTAWIALFIVQVALVAVGRTDLHRRLGTLGIALVPLIFAVGVPMSLVAAKLGEDHMPGPPLPALALVLASFVEFATLAGTGLWYRSRSDIHKRLMLMASLTAMEAGAIRLPIGLLDHGFTKTHMATDILLLLILAVDTVKHRRLHPAFLWGLLFLVSMQVFSLWLATTNEWAHSARAFLDSFG
jgi:hypothetical protein